MFRKASRKIKSNKHVKKVTGFVGRNMESTISITFGGNFAFYVVWFFITNIISFTVIAFLLMSVLGMDFSLTKIISMCVSFIISIGFLTYLYKQEKAKKIESDQEAKN
ncbi:hypothetical protein ABEW59_29685 [Bacillus wiedmannii]|uniref:hypothetical protein n=1 Tax=Bacillus wiedmannii TaxID=1890302 RepID=UPI003D26114C